MVEERRLARAEEPGKHRDRDAIRARRGARKERGRYLPGRRFHTTTWYERQRYVTG
jgi:hypothetical protein